MDTKPEKTAEDNKEYGSFGLALCHDYYEETVRQMLEADFPELIGRVAAGLVGQGSECYQADDEISRDHDWGPGVCLWLSDEDYAAYGEQLAGAYEKLPHTFHGFERITSAQGGGRVGVLSLHGFLTSLVGERAARELYEAGEKTASDFSPEDGKLYFSEELYLSVPEFALASLTNGRIFDPGDGRFERIREKLRKGYPKSLKAAMLAQNCARYSQTLQYNVLRSGMRGDGAGVLLQITKGLEAAAHLVYLSNDVYMPHEKLMLQGTRRLYFGAALPELADELYDIGCSLFQYLRTQAEGEDRNKKTGGEAEAMRNRENYLTRLRDLGNRLADYLYEEMTRAGLIGVGRGKDIYMEDLTRELMQQSMLEKMTDEQLVEHVVKLEWNAFDRVKNEGGRANCQDDWYTFSIMRKSQYLTWRRDMLIRYAVDFALSMEDGWNPITEKYGRMEASTAPEKWEAMKDQFPPLSEQELQIIDTICAIQVRWMEEFAEKYPMMAGNSRSIYSSDDTYFNTSYETYLRGELSSYSDTMLTMYGGFVVELYRGGENLARKIMEQTALLYGYESLEDAERKLRKS